MTTQNNLAVMVPKPKPKRAPTLYFIVGVKLLKGVAALLLALGAYSLTDNNLPEDFRKLLVFFHIDPEKKFFLELGRPRRGNHAEQSEMAGRRSR